MSEAEEAEKQARAELDAAVLLKIAQKGIWDFGGGICFVALALLLRPVASALAFAGSIGFVLYYLAIFILLIVVPRFWIYGLVRSYRFLRARFPQRPARITGIVALILNFFGLSIWLVFLVLQKVPWIPGSTSSL
ncbi:MAG: hypothetical protein IT461_02465 [Planctomycetes bacterium]|jgi:hypothetical protein|nr:hypothetical protein [Planctomycetota bacterium]